MRRAPGAAVAQDGRTFGEGEAGRPPIGQRRRAGRQQQRCRHPHVRRAWIFGTLVGDQLIGAVVGLVRRTHGRAATVGAATLVERAVRREGTGAFVEMLAHRERRLRERRRELEHAQRREQRRPGTSVSSGSAENARSLHCRAVLQGAMPTRRDRRPHTPKRSGGLAAGSFGQCEGRASRRRKNCIPQQPLRRTRRQDRPERERPRSEGRACGQRRAGDRALDRPRGGRRRCARRRRRRGP